MKTGAKGRAAAKAEYEYQIQMAKIDIELKQKELELEVLNRREIGLFHLEQDASVIFASLQKAVIELAFYHEMGKNKFVLDDAALKVANTRIMYDSVCRKIFKLCIKHGLKSEHLK